MIYIFIAASYFPWLILSPAIRTNEITLHFWWIVWLFAVVGVIYQQVFIIYHYLIYYYYQSLQNRPC